jgi:hypothetical protein
MVKYHIKTPHGTVTRTSRRQTEPQFTHIVVYDKHVGVPGDRSKGQVPTFHGSASLAYARSMTDGAEVFAIAESDYTVK